ncbi:MAG: TetR/AcrR family transcriptional regulator [Arenicella sp.]|nr:TetR/AcrR family transcriptional regulator [Arenicella sp.]
MTALQEKKAAFTRKLILDAARELIDTIDISALSFKKVSEQAEISQRTMFRYFTTREAFLDALTTRLYAELELPDIPGAVDKLPDYIAELYRKLDAKPRIVTVLLSADLLPRVLSTTAKARLEALKKLLAETHPHCSKADITKTAANLRYVMSASSWRYYRHYFELELDIAIDCAQLLVAQSLEYLEKQK